MSKTVVGLFADNAVAQSAKQQLVSAGYSPSAIQIVAQELPGVTTPTHESSDTGWGAKISNFFHSLTGGDADENYYTQGVKQGGALLSVTVADGEEEDVADLLEDYGARNVNENAGKAATAAAAGVSAGPTASQAIAGSATIPVVQEELKVGKRQVDRGGVRIYSHLVETPVEENIKLREERVRIERQPVNRPATEADFTAFKEGSIELTETAEEAVVGKSARVVEEIAIGKETSERTQKIRDTVRHTEVEVTDLGAGASGIGVAEHEHADREHFDSAYEADSEAYIDRESTVAKP